MILLLFLVQCVLSKHIVSWFGTQEGMSMQVINLNYIYNVALTNGFNLRVMSFHNMYHYPEFPAVLGGVSICNYFIFPDNIDCLQIQNRSQYMNTIEGNNCVFITRDNTHNATNAQEEWYYSPRSYNLNKLPAIKQTVEEIDFELVNCIVGSPSHFVPNPTDINSNNQLLDYIPLKFLSFHMNLLQIALVNLELENYEYVGVHWRREDQLRSRCKPTNGRLQATDNSVNCASAKVFLNRLHEDIKASNGRSNTVYIATNENKPKVLNQLRAFNKNMTIKTFSDIGFSSSTVLTSVDRFIIEVLILTYSKQFLYYGTSSVQVLVNRARLNNGIAAKPN